MNKTLHIRILKPGLHTSIQDHGRMAYRSFGVPSSGPMDKEAAILANRMVGNDRHQPVMEFALIGPEMEITGEGNIALTGASFEVMLDQQNIPKNQLIAISGKHHLRIASTRSGCWGYLSVAGSWRLPHWLNSASTSPQNSSQLTPESVIQVGSVFEIVSGTTITPETAKPTRKKAAHIRILPGPEYHQMSTNTVKELLSKTFTISSLRNRMGYRLVAPLSSYQNPLEIISSGVTPGTVQITHSGQLIVLMADGQTTGGYPRIANVISADLGELSQLNPGESFTFKLVSLLQAYQAIESSL